MFRFGISSWLTSLFVGFTLLAAPLSAAIVPVGDVTPSTIGQVPSTTVVVGNDDVGGLTIDAGSVLTTQTGTLGMSETGIGAATITGAGSQWTNSALLHIGRNGTGILDIESGGKFTSSTTTLGNGTLSTGTVTITGDGSEWTYSDQLNVGGAGSGTVLIEAGGQFSGAAANLGRDSGSTGAVIVNGAGSKWTNVAILVGGSGSGELSIESGGQVISANTSYLGYYAGSSGEATITGTGSKWTNNTALHVGYQGSGKLTVVDSGEAVVGTLYVSLGDLFGNGTITATKGAVLDVNFVFDAVHGNQAAFSFGSGGTLSVSAAGGDLGVSNGSVTVSQGINIASQSGYVGYRSGSTGTATVTGAGTQWTASNLLVVGEAGNGSLVIEAGAQASSKFGYLARSVGSTATTIISGAGSKWTNTSGLHVGNAGTGLLRIEEGGQVSSNYSFVSGNQPGSIGTAIVTGTGSKWTNYESLTVGVAGTGTLTIEVGGQVSIGTLVNNSDSYLGRVSGSTGTATVTGVGSKWTNAGSAYVGDFGSGTLTLISGGLMTVSGTLTIDRDLNSDSFINMATGGKLAIRANADDSLTQFLGRISGTDAIRYWDATLADWSPLTAAIFGVDYTLEYLTTGDFAGYTLLTVGMVGDFDGNRVVDGRDLLAWQRNPHLGSLADWQNAYGSNSLSAATGVPEPSCFVLMLGLMLLSGRVRAVLVRG